jgi:hypothetical protein
MLGVKDRAGFASSSTNLKPLAGWNMFADALLFTVHAVSKPISVPAHA